MSKKFLVTGLVIGLLIGLSIGYFLPSLISNQLSLNEITDHKVSLTVTNMAIQVTGDYYLLRVSANLPYNSLTLFNCVMKVSYLTENNLWKTASENIGLVNYGQYVEPHVKLDADFKIGDPTLEHSNYYHSYDGANVEVEVYGYIEP